MEAGEIKIIRDHISKQELSEMAKKLFGDLVKAVVDIEQEIMALGGGVHAEEEVILMNREGSKREHTWGVNLYPEKKREDFVEFDSMINLKPAFGNRARGIENPETRQKILKIIEKLVQ